MAEQPIMTAPRAPASARPIVRGLLHNVAFWQSATFLMLVCVVWINEILDLPTWFFGQQPSTIDWFGGCILTAGILLVGIITVGHTYVQQQRILKGMIIVCSYCERVKIEETNWERIEEYLAAKTLARFSHGICPDCWRRHRPHDPCPPPARSETPSSAGPESVRPTADADPQPSPAPASHRA